MIVRKAVKMAALMHVPVLGLVENMTHLLCPSCGTRIDLFGGGAGRGAAGCVGIPLLASIPVDPSLATLCDNGGIESYRANPFDSLVEAIDASLDASGGTS